ncbi:PAS domain-containing sensor histidine kinase [Sporomusa sphaeroides]|uniref:histidine kinase n=1 Tax=Sporomusa sphaeroides DSM 2875 TaxID=1337886 RepID=A0ABM9W6B9_9FIRM|nr:PAS domain-containing sensor histidine kinase [Sporomusa sphaeroides]OLS57606.1 sporulation kinase E [Sporomusa sphaeroides DSM 2875]CVK20698.1 Sporulation kinase E [Sporomusa sphaeroides DSM 2875]
MDYIYLSVMSSLVGTLAIILVCIYLYALYRVRYMVIWAIGWLILLLRYVILDSGLVPWKLSVWGLSLYQTISLLFILMIVWSTYSLINKPLSKWWVYGTAGILIASSALNVLAPTLPYKLLFPVYAGCFALIWIGFLYIRHLKAPRFGRLVVGWAYILMGLLNFIFPFTVNGSWYVPLCYVLGGTVRLVIAIGTLILFFEKTRTDLSNKEIQYQLLAENAIDVIYYYRLSPEAALEYISPSVLTVTGYPPENYYADNKLIFKLVHPDDRALLNNFINNLPYSVETPLTIRVLREDKSTIWIEQKCVPIYDEQGRLMALEGIIRDITQRKKLEQMASAFDRMHMVGSMAATVAHEIRNPMTTVRGYLQVLGRKEKYQTDKEKFELMIEEIDRANSIIREYLSLSHEKFVSLKKCSLNHIIKALFPLIQADANSSKVYVTLDLSDIPELPLDENEIRQLLLNLVRNGIEAMPLGGNLVIGTVLADNKAVLSISDQGSEIPPHILEHLGTPFFTTKDTGTGLGLPICYQIAHRHNASIQIDTSDTGTTFFVNFNPPAP